MHLLILALVIGYVVGMFQTGYFVGKYYGIDIREFGSKSAGMTNINRTLGKFPALFVFVFDVLKAVMAFVLIPIALFGATWSFISWLHIFYGDTMFQSAAPLLAGLGAILGHNFPFFLNFKGGKGIACTLGIILMLDWQVALIAFAVGFVIVGVFRYISLASLAITLVWPVLLLIFGWDIEFVLLSAVISALAWLMHRENITRLLSGTERRFKLGK